MPDIRLQINFRHQIKFYRSKIGNQSTGVSWPRSWFVEQKGSREGGSWKRLRDQEDYSKLLLVPLHIIFLSYKASNRDSALI